MQERLNPIEFRLRYDCWHLHRYPLLFRAGFMPATVHLVVVMQAGVGPACQDAVNTAHEKRIAALVAESVMVQPGRDVLDAERPLGSIAFQKQLEYLPHRGGFAFIDFQALFDFLTALFRFDCAVTERGDRTVPESLPSILDHGAAGVLGVFRAGKSVRRRDYGFGEIGGRTNTKILGYGDQRDAVFLQPALGNDISGGIAEKAGLAMNEDNIKRGGIGASRFHDALKFGAFVIPGGRARVHKLSNHEPAPPFAKAAGLGQLIRD